MNPFWNGCTTRVNARGCPDGQPSRCDTFGMRAALANGAATGVPQLEPEPLDELSPELAAIFVPGCGTKVTMAIARVPVGSRLPALYVDAPIKMPTCGVRDGVTVGGGGVLVGRKLLTVA